MMADLLKLTEKSMSMDDRSWKRHANPWSVWTRAVTFLPIIAAIWIHEAYGWWISGALLAVLAFWIWYNPRAFGTPPTTNSWASKATFGERVLLNRKRVAIPKHHTRFPLFLSGMAAPGAVLAIYGAVVTEFWPMLCGVILMYAGKMWFLDRMVWLYEEMKDATPEYRSWLY